MKKQFIVQEEDSIKREEFYDYILNKYNFKIGYPFTKEEFINIGFPFVIDFSDKTFWICRSVACCAAAASAKAIISIEEFKERNK